ncbi:hypothetical protein S7711_07251 [Stachybotrys chartarum IBT 7711]|uniref:Uncharacterized protein n=1 Tax=Stachybotrys chartarum (strain CBS 109288 / IBT 7711) TaxID=1280523 RepID=A0A084AGS5_STACB|nr:hypothetical protein S7711_07251 [Stachybotrys chartarum IBT 7711]KFA47769.1 hypothetical protein S40293_07150 [Stachybotrys chartarum IBT 40293]KFA81865.1 hypothetical protein S40288_01742 [Stachybotrys chartarum IBT 40288]
MALLFAGKHCAIVGATGIIGSSIAKAFASQGAVLSVLGRTALQVQPQLQRELRPPQQGQDGTPSAHQFICLDVSSTQSIKDAFSAQTSGVGPIDILVNCAGISQTTLLKRTPDEELSGIINTNLLATMLVCKHAKIRAQGCIINVSSLMATKGGSGATAYAASKAGVIGFTRALCREMSPRSIRVNALLPGWVDSPMWNHLKQKYLDDTPLRRVADPAEVADAAVFLAANGFANNCVLNLDGGLSAA